MHARLIASLCPQTGLPLVEVPHEAIWELAEHLSTHRTAVTFSHRRDCFTVSFTRLDLAAAQRFLDDWNCQGCYQIPTPEPAAFTWRDAFAQRPSVSIPAKPVVVSHAATGSPLNSGL